MAALAHVESSVAVTWLASSCSSGLLRDKKFDGIFFFAGTNFRVRATGREKRENLNLAKITRYTVIGNTVTFQYCYIPILGFATRILCEMCMSIKYSNINTCTYTHGPYIPEP